MRPLPYANADQLVKLWQHPQQGGRLELSPAVYREWKISIVSAAACVLVIACANLANLLIAPSLTKRRELLVRSALGAGRERLIRQSITESLVLAVLGGALGVVIAKLAVPLLARLVPTTLPIAQSPVIDPRILLFAAFLTAITGIGFGVLPAWRSAGAVDLSGVRDGARAGGGQRERARSALVVTEIMASLVLLISAGLLMRALLRRHATTSSPECEWSHEKQVRD